MMKPQTEKHQCERQMDGHDGWSYGLCGKPAKVLYEGQWYCGIHDPIKRKAKIEASMQLHEIERQRREEEYKRRKAEQHYCEHLTTEYLEQNQAEIPCQENT